MANIIKASLVLIVCLTLFGAGNFNQQVLAQNDSIRTKALQASSCCKLKHTFTIGNETYFRGDVLGPVGTIDCGGLTMPIASIDCCDLHSSNARGYKFNTANWAGICFLDGVKTVSDWIFWITTILVSIALVFSGIMFVVFAGSPEKIKLARTIFFWSLIGVLVAVFGKFIPSLFRYFVGI